jgi:hypothetical protein
MFRRSRAPPAPSWAAPRRGEDGQRVARPTSCDRPSPSVLVLATHTRAFARVCGDLRRVSTNLTLSHPLSRSVPFSPRRCSKKKPFSRLFVFCSSHQQDVSRGCSARRGFEKTKGRTPLSSPLPVAMVPPDEHQLHDLNLNGAPTNNTDPTKFFFSLQFQKKKNANSSEDKATPIPSPRYASPSATLSLSLSLTQHLLPPLSTTRR